MISYITQRLRAGLPHSALFEGWFLGAAAFSSSLSERYCGARSLSDRYGGAPALAANLTFFVISRDKPLITP